MQTCYRHPDHPAGIICQRCDRPICSQCMHQASVGFHCPECVAGGKQKVISGPAAFVTQPIVTQALMAANVVLFLIGSLVDKGFNLGFGGGGGTWEEKFALFTRASTDNAGQHLIGVGTGEVYRMVTAGFMHAGLLHLAVNMYALWILGRVIEHLAGRARMLTIYGVAMLSGALGALLLTPNDFTVGASGAIFGLMGAVLVVERMNGISILRSALLPTLIINVIISIGVPEISLGGHGGGLVGGAVAGWLLLDFGNRPGIDRRLPYALCGLVALACVVGAYVFSSGQMLRG